jgi:hypothetical protein
VNLVIVSSVASRAANGIERSLCAMLTTRWIDRSQERVEVRVEVNTTKTERRQLHLYIISIADMKVLLDDQSLNSPRVHLLHI